MQPFSLIKVCAALFVLGLIVWFVLSWHVARDHVSAYPVRVGAPPADFLRPLTPVEFRTSDGLLLRGWHAEPEGRRGTVILLHGYRCSRRHMLDRARILSEAGYGVLLYDARGCGESEGNLISIGYYETEDLLAAVDYLRSHGAEDIALLGVSQGGATILLAAERLHDIRAVIIESVYDRALHATDRRFRIRTGLPGWLVGFWYRPFIERRLGVSSERISPVDHVGQLSAPILIISGAKDRHTLPEHTRNLYDAANEPKELWLVPDAGHEDVFTTARDEYREKVLGFLERTSSGGAG